MEIISESDCFGRAFLALEKIKTKEELFISPSPKIKAMIDEITALAKELMDKIASRSDMNVSGIPTVAADHTDRPRLLVMAGSATGVMQVGLLYGTGSRNGNQWSEMSVLWS